MSMIRIWSSEYDLYRITNKNKEKEPENKNHVEIVSSSSDVNTVKVDIFYALTKDNMSYIINEKSKILELKNLILKSKDIPIGSQIIVHKGKVVDDTVVLGKLLNSSAVKESHSESIKLLLVVSNIVKFTWCDSRSSEDVVIYQEGKTFCMKKGEGDVYKSYCSEKYLAITKQSIPLTNEDCDIHIKFSGREIACYDAVGVVTGDFSVMDDRLGDTSNSWSIHCYPYGTPGSLGGAHHSANYVDVFNEYSRGGVITLRINQKSCKLNLLWNGEDKGIVFTDLPSSTPLYVVGRVCGHDGNAKLTILDEFSMPNADDEYNETLMRYLE